jgi:hypothetical protein
MNGYLLDCPTVVISHSLKLSVKHCSRHGTMKVRHFHHDGPGPCCLHVWIGLLLLPAAFRIPGVFLPFRLKLPLYCVSSPLHPVESLLPCVMLLLRLMLPAAHYWSCRDSESAAELLSKVFLIISSNLLGPAFVPFILFFSSWRCLCHF